MEVQLQELIDKIKNEGIDTAKTEAARLVTMAEARAKDIVAKAEAGAKTTMESAQARAKLDEERGKEALVQACRDLLLNLTGRITTLFDAALKTAVAKSMSGDTLAGAISDVLKGLDKTKNYEILVSDDQATTIANALKSVIVAEFKNGVEIKPTKGVNAGFRIVEKNGEAFYDFSSDAVAANLAAYVNPKLAEEIMKAVKA